MLIMGTNQDTWAIIIRRSGYTELSYLNTPKAYATYEILFFPIIMDDF